MIAGGNIAMDANRQAFWQWMVWVLVGLGAKGCATSSGKTREDYINDPSMPDWVKNPPQDHYVGISDCVPSKGAGEFFAFTDALKKKCQSTSGRIHLTDFYPPVQREQTVLCEEGGMMVFALFRNQDLNCDLIKPSPQVSCDSACRLSASTQDLPAAALQLVADVCNRRCVRTPEPSRTADCIKRNPQSIDQCFK